MTSSVTDTIEGFDSLTSTVSEFFQPFSIETGVNKSANEPRDRTILSLVWMAFVNHSSHPATGVIRFFSDAPNSLESSRGKDALT